MFKKAGYSFRAAMFEEYLRSYMRKRGCEAVVLFADEKKAVNLLGTCYNGVA